ICSLDEHYKSRLQRVTGDKQFMHTFSEDDGLALTFDNNATIQIKYCDLRAILNGVAYGIAIFDADQDAWDKNPCYYGPQNFQRTTMIRKLIDLVSKTRPRPLPRWLLVAHLNSAYSAMVRLHIYSVVHVVLFSMYNYAPP
ncbi:hypothetical protein MTO96_037450, partial [Rhipicephalus appendiculatus]